MINPAMETERFTLEFFAGGSKVFLRPAVKEDAFDIIENVEEIIQKGRYLQKERVRTIEEEQAFIEEMKQKDNMYTAVEVDGRVVGIARLIRGELKMKRHTAFFRTWLSNSAQGIGLGNKMMDYTIHWGKLHGLHKICLTVFAANKIARQLYEKYGFVVEGVQKQQVYFNGEYDDEIMMAYFYNNPTP
ncbi:Protein N-acetyltransferase, RimJ/RimL family [Evansella caseinilytica]|uniref:Protein N-acetyltransferase, RimJ/RimL family n=1 Tax=Evansella caseinilytica TaxID=1503961 RepID=A0A1H3L266_9BACI|nr:GNAT family protein [Evansella caseinilytica]SDY58607.1 Protein N-acetyltransferase, RimJ/RimL family [Evansella caseinilytica]